MARDTTVYPRAYGGTPNTYNRSTVSNGLSPRVRGNLGTVGAGFNGMRSIPARTGEPTSGGDRSVTLPVYPRAYGGTSPTTFPDFEQGQGLSPRVRGNHSLLADQLNLHGSIPARTGEPGHPARGCKSRPVYPRAYGGTWPLVTAAPAFIGLSPRVRGNLVGEPAFDRMAGSIPARTGEP